MKPSAPVVRAHRILGYLAVLHSALLLGVLLGVETGTLTPSGFGIWPTWLAYTWLGAASLWLLWPIILVLHPGRSALRIALPLLAAVLFLLPCVRRYRMDAWWLFIGSHQGFPTFTTKVDWFKPEPKSWDFDAGVHIPRGLIIGVAPSLHDQAIALLGDTDVVDLTREQAEHFAPQAASDDALQSGINEKIEWVRREAMVPIQSKGWNRRALKTLETYRQRSIERDNLEIQQLRQWEHQLKPFLIKAVTLAGPEGFEGQFLSDDLLIVHGSMGYHGGPRPMKRMPVVAFLPKKPRKVYTRLSVID